MKRLKWKLSLVYLEIVLILMQDRSTVCMDIDYARKSNWMHPMELVDEMCERAFRPLMISVINDNVDYCD